ncbi:hypothetical protein [Nostoc sp. NMS8]|uniref:hypothetical protein n=1 Tax=Nostoc sp. NMS8 TaxID=2815392 RepID=UPI0025D717F8|nr:hypothetical protein [Nostoc sp. NMS8]MBN3959892.1 hypothetical protein [Nostoc sp. NMS8]
MSLKEHCTKPNATVKVSKSWVKMGVFAALRGILLKEALMILLEGEEAVEAVNSSVGMPTFRI